MSEIVFADSRKNLYVETIKNAECPFTRTSVVSLENPVVVNPCKHIFDRAAILRHRECPLDGKSIANAKSVQFIQTKYREYLAPSEKIISKCRNFLEENIRNEICPLTRTPVRSLENPVIISPCNHIYDAVSISGHSECPLDRVLILKLKKVKFYTSQENDEKLTFQYGDAKFHLPAIFSNEAKIADIYAAILPEDFSDDNFENEFISFVRCEILVFIVENNLICDEEIIKYLIEKVVYFSPYNEMIRNQFLQEAANLLEDGSIKFENIDPKGKFLKEVFNDALNAVKTDPFDDEAIERSFRVARGLVEMGAKLEISDPEGKLLEKALIQLKQIKKNRVYSLLNNEAKKNKSINKIDSFINEIKKYARS